MLFFLPSSHAKENIKFQNYFSVDIIRTVSRLSLFLCLSVSLSRLRACVSARTRVPSHLVHSCPRSAGRWIAPPGSSSRPRRSSARPSSSRRSRPSPWPGSRRAPPQEPPPGQGSGRAGGDHGATDTHAHAQAARARKPHPDGLILKQVRAGFQSSPYQRNYEQSIRGEGAWASTQLFWS